MRSGHRRWRSGSRTRCGAHCPCSAPWSCRSHVGHSSSPLPTTPGACISSCPRIMLVWSSSAGLAEHHGQVGAGELRDALRLVYNQQKDGTITPEIMVAFEHRFDDLLGAGLKANPPASPVPERRGRTKQTPGRNLALRCRQHRVAVLRFLYDEGVPFDNNQAERDVRPWCVKRKVSRGFRSEEGGGTSPASGVKSRSFASRDYTSGMAW